MTGSNTIGLLNVCSYPNTPPLPRIRSPSSSLHSLSFPLRFFLSRLLLPIHLVSNHTFAALQDNTKADHGFSSGSQAVQFLYSGMAEFNETERRQFLQFVTGSPRLPVSGFKGLTPKYVPAHLALIIHLVVCHHMYTYSDVACRLKKHHDPPLTPDHYLPSVMSCTNYLNISITSAQVKWTSHGSSQTPFTLNIRLDLEVLISTEFYFCYHDL